MSTIANASANAISKSKMNVDHESGQEPSVLGAGITEEDYQEILDRILEQSALSSAQHTAAGQTWAKSSAPVLDPPIDHLPKITTELAMIILLGLDEEQSQQTTAAAAEMIQIDKTVQDAARQDVLRAIDESIKAIGELKKTGDLNQFFSWASPIVFGVISAVPIVAGIATAVTAGAAIPAVLVVAGVCLIAGETIMIAQLAKPEEMSGVFGDSSSDKIAASVMWTVLSSILMLGTGMGVLNALKESTKTIQTAFALSTTLEFATTGGQGVTQIMQTEASNKKDLADANTQMINAFIDYLVANREKMRAMIEDAFDRMAEKFKKTKSAIDSHQDSRRQVIANLRVNA